MNKSYILILLFLSLTPAVFAADFESAAASQVPLKSWELNLYGGSYLGRHLGQTWTGGVKTRHHFNRLLSLGLRYGTGSLEADSSSAFGGAVSENFFHLGGAEVTLSNEALLHWGPDWVPMDFYLTLGSGAMKLNSSWEPYGLIGGGVKFYTGLPWLGVTVDVDNYAHMTPILTGDTFDMDTLFTVGLALLF